MYVSNSVRQELRDIEKECVRINNVLATPSQNNVTEEKEKALRAKLKYLYLKEERIYNRLINQMEED